MIIENQAMVTDAVVEAVLRVEDARLREILLALVRHLHGFVREVRLTEREFQEAVRTHRGDGTEDDALAQRSGADGGLTGRVLARLSAQ